MKLELPGYLQRMIEEDIALEKKASALNEYITKNINKGDSCLCEEAEQLKAMMEYGQALNVRIDTAIVTTFREKLYKNRYPKNKKAKKTV